MFSASFHVKMNKIASFYVIFALLSHRDRHLGKQVVGYLSHSSHHTQVPVPVTILNIHNDVDLLPVLLLLTVERNLKCLCYIHPVNPTIRMSYILIYQVLFSSITFCKRSRSIFKSTSSRMLSNALIISSRSSVSINPERRSNLLNPSI